MENLYTYDDLLNIAKNGWCIKNQPHNFKYVGEVEQINQQLLMQDGRDIRNIPSGKLKTMKMKMPKYRCTICGKITY